ncbi:MAG TPA: D-Ala-D-Ala carboxypeptidase family metallohydrolase [Gemmatimonadaceae bacterium]|nr:D-Ala-D-Ala carboxypeptidase family metallohydrolase [Gemmatimonadaceae bacterium]
MTGLSGKLRARFIRSDFAPKVPLLAELFGDSVVARAGVYTVDSARAAQPFAFITMRPFTEKKNGRIGAYRIGNWPSERRSAARTAYANPEGFIEVTPENQDTYVSEHFRLRDFLTKDQHAVWPKYLVLDARLLDKLELVIAELSRTGVPVRHVSVMSGFRTPQYNQQGVGAGGRAQTSRHQYGDAADVFVDNDRDGRMDDLNNDGRVNTLDVAVMVAAVERVERAHPELVGGAGTYKATSSHGPFLHIDARGQRARW